MLNSQQIEKLDKLASDAIRANNPKCFMGNHVATAVHHVIHRNHKSVRWCKENLVPICFECHRMIHDDIEFNQLFMEKYDREYGSGTFDALAVKARGIAKGLDYETIKGEIDVF